MKVLRRAKRALALLLAVSMLLPSVMSVMANGETADDTSGWTIGSTSQLSGNPTKGWKLELGTHDGTSSAYQAQIDVARLQMGFDLSGLADDHTFILGFGDKQTGFGETESNVIYILLGKKSNSSMELQCFKNNSFLTNISVELDLTVPHKIGLQKSGNSWGIALDGEIRYTLDEIGQFVEAMASVSSNRTKVTFTPWTAGDKTGLIKNITFADLGSGSSMGDTTKLTGNPKDGWRLQVVGDPWGDYRNAAYEAAIDVTKLQIHFNLSEFTMDRTVRMKIGSTGFAQGIDLYLERVQDSVLRIYGIYSGKMGTVADKTFDFAADHVLEFVRAGGKWALAIDGVAWLEDDFYGTFIDSMSVSEGKTVVRINGHAGWNAEGNYPTIVINGINFTEKPALLKGYSATLEGMIGYNYHVSLSKELAGRNDVFMHFAYGEGITQDVPMNPEAYKKEDDVYIFTCKLPAKHMADTVTAQLYAGDEPVCTYPGGQTVAYTSSVKEYAAGVLKQLETDNTDTSAVTKTLVKNMLHYGAYAQKYFRYNTGNLADAGLDDLDVSDVTQGSFQTAFEQTNLNADGFGKIVGSNLYLKSETDLKVYIELAEGVDADKLTFTCQDKSSEPLKIGRYTRNGKELVTVIIPNIAAHELNNVWDITVVKKDGQTSTGTWKYSVFTYAYNALDAKYKPDTTRGITIAELLQAMYKYNEAALAYKTASE